MEFQFQLDIRPSASTALTPPLTHGLPGEISSRMVFGSSSSATHYTRSVATNATAMHVRDPPSLKRRRVDDEELEPRAVDHRSKDRMYVDPTAQRRRLWNHSNYISSDPSRMTEEERQILYERALKAHIERLIARLERAGVTPVPFVAKQRSGFFANKKLLIACQQQEVVVTYSKLDRAVMEFSRLQNMAENERANSSETT